MGEALQAVRTLAFAIACAGVAYCLFASFLCALFRARKPRRGPERPRVSILKPIHGLDPELYDNLCTFCEQEYPDFEVILGTTDAEDAALEVMERIRARFADRVSIVVAPAGTCANPKVANLANMLPHASGEVYVIADADMRAGTTYLQTIVDELCAPHVGAVTCAYGGIPSPNEASRFGAAFINDHFAPSVLVAETTEGLRYCFGATMAVRRETLEAIGGIEALGAYVGDDYVLGKLVAQRGLRVVLSTCIVHTLVHEPDFGAMWHHQLRWMRTIRAQRPLGHALLFLTYPLPFALAYLLASLGTPTSATLLVAALIVRITLANASAKTLDVSADPLRAVASELLTFGVWAASFFAKEVRWRGERMSIGEHGAITYPR